MADDQDTPNDVEEGGDAPEISDYDESAVTAATQQSTTASIDDYEDDEPIEDYVVKLTVNEQPDGSLPADVVNAGVADIAGDMSSKTTLYDTVNSYTTDIYDQLNGNSTGITGGKRWWGWSTKKLLIIGLIALCVLALILAIVFLVLGKKFKKNKRGTPGGTTTVTKSVVSKNPTSDPKYHQVSNA